MRPGDAIHQRIALRHPFDVTNEQTVRRDKKWNSPLFEIAVARRVWNVLLAHPCTFRLHGISDRSVMLNAGTGLEGMNASMILSGMGLL
jgi:hypothetical protein